VRNDERTAGDDKKYLWHPYTCMADWEEEDIIVIERGRGARLIDTLGREYLDGVSSLWVNLHGHGRREIDDAVSEQLGRIAHSTLLGLASVPSVELARRLVGLAPDSLERVFFSDNGSTAVEVALKLAFQYWQIRGRPEKRLFLSLDNAYHGDTIGAVSVGGIEEFHSIFKPLLFPAVSVTSPYCYRCPLGLRRSSCATACAEKAAGIIASRSDEAAALIIEPKVQGAGGMIVQPEGYLARVAEACRDSGVLLIADEVAVGFGRTGRMFACEHEGIQPDMMALGKGITGGYLPLAATLVSGGIYEAFRDRKFYHGHSFTGNQLACSAALASFGIFEREDVIAGLKGKIDRFRGLLGPVAELEHVGEVRQCGLMAGIELVADGETGRPYRPGEKIGHRVVLEARRRGLIVRPLGDVIVLMPPYCMTDGELEQTVSITREAIAMVTEKGRR